MELRSTNRSRAWPEKEESGHKAVKEWQADVSAKAWIHRRVDICLQMDTEMKRSGIEVTGFEGLIRDLNFLYDVLKVQWIMHEWWQTDMNACLIMINKIPQIFLDSSMVEHSAVNRRVVGSSPTRGVSLYMPIWLNWQSSWFVISRLTVRVRLSALFVKTNSTGFETR